MHATVSGTRRQKCKIDTVASTNEFHEKVIKPFISIWNFTSIWYIRVAGSSGFVNASSKILPWHWKQGVSDLRKRFSENFI